MFSKATSTIFGEQCILQAIGDRKAARHSKSQLEVTPSEGELAFFSDPVTLRFDVADDEVDKGTGIVWSTVVRAVEQKGSSTLYYGSYSDHVDRQVQYLFGTVIALVVITDSLEFCSEGVSRRVGATATGSSSGRSCPVCTSQRRRRCCCRRRRRRGYGTAQVARNTIWQ